MLHGYRLFPMFYILLVCCHQYQIHWSMTTLHTFAVCYSYITVGVEHLCYHTKLRQSQSCVLISKISYKCKWGLTGFCQTKELGFDVTTVRLALTVLFLEYISTMYGLGYILAVKNINTLWLGVYTRHTPWHTPVKPFEVWLQWDRSYSYITVGVGYLWVRGEVEDKC